MSEASERKAWRESLAGYCLMTIPQVAAFFGSDPDVIRKMVADGVIPSVPVGTMQKVDPLDVAVHVLAGREGVTPEEYWTRHGEATAEHARRYFARIRKLMATAA